MKHVLLLLLIATPLFCSSQKEGNIWYFGNKAGVDFNSGVPVKLTNSAMNTGHGCASISDKCSGELLFYTDGSDVWDSTHTIMPNGSGLLGDKLSTQSAIIVPHPDTTKNFFYIFTVQASGSGGIHYSEVNMNLNSGKGDIVTATKNTALISPTAEKLTAVKHRNNTDVWVITHELNSNSFYAYLITPAGLGATPVISKVGTVYSNDAIKGYLKASPDGKYLAAALRNLNTFDVFDFDFDLGIVSNQIRFNSNYPGAYGVEFSPDGTKLYATINSNGLYQFDLEAGNATDIENSGVRLSSIPNVAIQLGPDSKIYTNEGRYLGVINNPNRKGVACNYTDNAVYLGASVFGNSGLPTFLQSYFNPISIVESNLCFGQQTKFSISNLQEIDSMKWNFGDPASGQANTSKNFTPTHQYDNPGVFNVQLIYHGNVCNKAVSDTILKDIEILNLPAPKVELGKDTVICQGGEVILDASSTATSFLWSDQSSSSQLTASEEGIYWVEVNNTCGTDRDSIELTFFKSEIQLSLGRDTTFCSGNSLTLDVAQNDASYLWNDGSTSPTYSIDKAGKYWVSVSDLCFTFSDTIEVNLIQPPKVAFVRDTILCPGDMLLLDARTEGATYNWQDGSGEPELEVSKEGTYYVKVSNPCGNSRAQTEVVYKDCSCVVYMPDAFTPDGDNINPFYQAHYSCEFQSFELQVYSRWGEMVYRTTNPEGAWDGKLDGKDLPAGAYVYHLKYKGKNNQEIKGVDRRGIIHLIR